MKQWSWTLVPGTALGLILFALTAEPLAAAAPVFGTMLVGVAQPAENQPLPEAAPLATVSVAHSGANWFAVRPDDLVIRGLGYMVRMTQGYVVNYRIGVWYRGDRVDVDLLPGEQAPPRGRNRMALPLVNGVIDLELHTDDLLPGQHTDMVAACRDQATDDNGFEAIYNLTVALQADAQRRRRRRLHGEYEPFGTSARKLVTGLVPIRVLCDPPPQHAEAPPSPVSLAVRTKQSGETCPKPVTVSVSADYEVETSAVFRVEQEGGRTKARRVKTRKVSLGGRSWQRAEAELSYRMDPGRHTFQVEVEGTSLRRRKTIQVSCPPFAVTSAWLDYDVEDSLTCPKKVIESVEFHTTRPGELEFEIRHQGGLVAHSGRVSAERKRDRYVAKAERTLSLGGFEGEFLAQVKGQSDANSGWMRVEIACVEVLGGTLTLRDGTEHSCPREVAAGISLRTDMAGPVPYRLDCTGGRSWERTAEARETAPGTFVAVDVLPFEIASPEHVNCALKSMVTGTAQTVTLQGRDYGC